MIWVGNQQFKCNVIEKLKYFFKFGSDEAEAFL